MYLHQELLGDIRANLLALDMAARRTLFEFCRCGYAEFGVAACLIAWVDRNT